MADVGGGLLCPLILLNHRELLSEAGWSRVHRLEREPETEPPLPRLAPAPRWVVVGKMKKVRTHGQESGHRHPRSDIQEAPVTKSHRLSRLEDREHPVGDAAGVSPVDAHREQTVQPSVLLR